MGGPDGRLGERSGDVADAAGVVQVDVGNGYRSEVQRAEAMVSESLQHNGYRALAASFDQDGGRPFDEIASGYPVPAAKAGCRSPALRASHNCSCRNDIARRNVGLRRSPCRRKPSPGGSDELLPKIKNVRVRPVETVHSEVSALVDRVTLRVGGPARLRVVLLLAGVLSLQSADIGTIGALAASSRKRSISTTPNLACSPRPRPSSGRSRPCRLVYWRTAAKRVRLFVWATAAWSVGMAASGLADGYLMLLLTRLALGAVIGVSGPVVASLTGDLFPAKDRARIYGMVLTGELVGTGLGLVISAELGAVAGWRAPFFVLAVPSLVLAVLLHRLLPEPARGGQSWLYPGAEEIKTADSVAAEAGATPVSPAGGTGQDLGLTPPPAPPRCAPRPGARRRPPQPRSWSYGRTRPSCPRGRLRVTCCGSRATWC